MKVCVIYFFLMFLLVVVACSHVTDDPLVQMSETVIKKDKGVDIQIQPVEKKK